MYTLVSLVVVGIIISWAITVNMVIICIPWNLGLTAELDCAKESGL